MSNTRNCQGRQATICQSQKNDKLKQVHWSHKQADGTAKQQNAIAPEHACTQDYGKRRQ
jgi:hypothetical protein